MKLKATRALQLIALMCAVALFSPVSLHAQESRGSITGNVTDASKGAVPGATVKITNVAMGTSATVQTNESGFFQAPYLPAGIYQIEVIGEGYKKTVRDGIELRVNDTLELNVELEVGAVTDTVSVTGETPLLDSTNANLGTVVDSRRISELPTPNGDPFALIGLTPGASYTGSQRLDRPFEPTHIVGYAMDGTRQNRSDVTIDGVSSTSTANANEVIASYVPPSDIVQEFKVQTATFDAASGNTEGGVTNISTKSGTNDLNGTAYWVRIPVGLTANDFFSNANNQPRPSFEYDRFGGYISGPVVLPKLYNGRNKTFFLWGYENISEARPRNNGIPTTPTEKMKRGDFSELLALGSQYQIYNPFTRRRDPNDANRIIADPFPGNIIPDNLINPVARNIVNNFFPDPVTPCAPGTNCTQNFQQPGLLERTEYYTNTIRIDHVLNDKNRMFGRASWYPRDSNYNNYFNNIATGEYFLFKSRQIAIDDVHTFNGTTVLNVRYGFNRFIRGTNSNPGNRGLDLTTLGFPARYNNLIPENIRRFPRIDFPAAANQTAPYQGTGIGGEFRPTDTHSFAATLNKVLGVHSVRFGTEFRAYRENSFFFGNNQTGQFIFDTTWTRGPFDNSTEAPGRLGQSFAAFLLGLPSPGSLVTVPADYSEQSTTLGLFVQDDWRVNSRLTLNLGLRYELEGALTERFNRSVKGFDFNHIQPIEEQARARYRANPVPGVSADEFAVRGGLNFASPESRGLYETPKTNFMPRIGFAYKLTDLTVVRGGYGIYFGFLGQRRGDVIQSGFGQNTLLNVSPTNGLPDANGDRFIETLSNPFQNGLLQPVGAAQGPQTFLGQPITFFNQNPKSPYNQKWQLGVQHELPYGLVGEASYVGSRSTHVEVTRNLNALPNRFLSTSPFRDDVRNTFLTGNVANPFQGLAGIAPSAFNGGSTIQRNRLLRPFPQFDTVNTTTNEGYAWYHSAQLALNKRFTKGYTFGMSYTFSKFMEAVELLNAGDARPIESISVADRPHRLSINGIVELPFGEGRRFLSGVGGFASKLISGWQVSGIYAYQSGPPITFGNSIFFGNIKDIVLPNDEITRERAFNPIGFVALRSGSTIVRNNGEPIWVDFNDPCKTSGLNNPACQAVPLTTLNGFNRDANLQLANNVRTFPLRFGSIRGDNINNVDFSILKRTAITEGTALEFRAEFLNAFNRAQFPSAPETNPAASNFFALTAGTQENYSRRIQLMLKFLF